MPVKTISCFYCKYVAIYNIYGFTRPSKSYAGLPHIPDDYSPTLDAVNSDWNFLLAPDALSEWSE